MLLAELKKMQVVSATEVSGYLAMIPPCIGLYNSEFNSADKYFQFKFEPRELSEAKLFFRIFILYSLLELKLLQKKVMFYF